MGAINIVFAPALPDTAHTGDAGHISDHNALSAALTTLQTFLNSYVRIGNGSPEGAVTASKGVLYLRQDGGAGTTLYVKESGTNTNTGWVAK